MSDDYTSGLDPMLQAILQMILSQNFGGILPPADQLGVDFDPTEMQDLSMMELPGTSSGRAVGSIEELNKQFTAEKSINSLLADPMTALQMGMGSYATDAFAPEVTSELIPRPATDQFNSWLAQGTDTFEGRVAKAVMDGRSPRSAIVELRQIYELGTREGADPDEQAAADQIRLMISPGQVPIDPETGYPAADARPEPDWSQAYRDAEDIVKPYMDEQKDQPGPIGEVRDAEGNLLSAGGEIVLGPDGQLYRQTTTPSPLAEKYHELGLPLPTEEYTPGDLLGADWQQAEQSYLASVPDIESEMERMQRDARTARENQADQQLSPEKLAQILSIYNGGGGGSATPTEPITTATRAAPAPDNPQIRGPWTGGTWSTQPGDSDVATILQQLQADRDRAAAAGAPTGETDADLQAEAERQAREGAFNAAVSDVPQTPDEFIQWAQTNSALLSPDERERMSAFVDQQIANAMSLGGLDNPASNKWQMAGEIVDNPPAQQGSGVHPFTSGGAAGMQQLDPATLAVIDQATAQATQYGPSMMSRSFLGADQPPPTPGTVDWSQAIAGGGGGQYGDPGVTGPPPPSNPMDVMASILGIPQGSNVSGRAGPEPSEAVHRAPDLQQLLQIMGQQPSQNPMGVLGQAGFGASNTSQRTAPEGSEAVRRAPNQQQQQQILGQQPASTSPQMTRLMLLKILGQQPSAQPQSPLSVLGQAGFGASNTSQRTGPEGSEAVRRAPNQQQQQQILGQQANQPNLDQLLSIFGQRPTTTSSGGGWRNEGGRDTQTLSTQRRQPTYLTDPVDLWRRQQGRDADALDTQRLMARDRMRLAGNAVHNRDYYRARGYARAMRDLGITPSSVASANRLGGINAQLGRS